MIQIGLMYYRYLKRLLIVAISGNIRVRVNEYIDEIYGYILNIGIRVSVSGRER